MQIFKTITGLKYYLKSVKQEQILGFVPTMGALHEGHQSLIKRAITETNLVVVSIFVNPLQFNPHEDLSKYPRPIEQDLKLCEELGVDVIFLPQVEEIYQANSANINTEILTETTQVIPPQSMINLMCGKSRPGHFAGVATIVLKLFNIIQPQVAYFGEKDAQQLAIIRRLVTDLNLSLEIRGCAIIREESGLALSSRNQYLSLEEKAKATILYQSLQTAKVAFQNGEREAKNLINLVANKLKSVTEINIDYIDLVHPETLQSLRKIEDQGLLAIAVYLSSTRLIDNMMLKDRQPIIAIDGPAGAGKSTVTRKIAQQLNLLYLDTGAMYRAVTWLVMKSEIPLDQEVQIAEILAQSHLELIPPTEPQQPIQVKINGEDITTAIRTPEVTRNVSAIAAQTAVREILVKKQQLLGKNGGIVAEGRDIGSCVFPDADLKIFLTATPLERARRRLQDLEKQGYKDINLQQLEAEIKERDHKDSSRQIAPLKKATDAIEVITDHLTIEEVVAKIISFL